MEESARQWPEAVLLRRQFKKGEAVEYKGHSIAAVGIYYRGKAKVESLDKENRRLSGEFEDFAEALAAIDDPAGYLGKKLVAGKKGEAFYAGCLLRTTDSHQGFEVDAVRQNEKPVVWATLAEAVAVAESPPWGGEEWSDPNMTARSFKVGVKTAGDKDWVGNAIRHATWKEAREAGSDLFGRWTAVRSWTVLPSEDEVHVYPKPVAAAG
jgi:hypothetical protein